MPISTVSQTAVPMAVISKNGSIGIRAVPAGMEIRLRTIGTHRQSSTAIFPRLQNHRSASSISSG